MGYETLLYDKREGIGYVTLNRPEKLNALNRKLVQELSACFHSIQGDDEVKAVILTGAGDKAFAAGADVSELALQSPIEGRETSRRGQRIFSLIENLGKPVIAAVNGYALGGGCELAMACTLRVAADTSRLGQPEVRLGIIPGYAGTQRLPRLVGKARALEMILTGEAVTAQEAYRIGLVNLVVKPSELISAAETLARKIMANGPVAVRFALEAVHRGLDVSQDQGELLEATLFGLVSTTADMREGAQAFLEKRTAKFLGK